MRADSGHDMAPLMPSLLMRNYYSMSSDSSYPHQAASPVVWFGGPDWYEHLVLLLGHLLRRLPPRRAQLVDVVTIEAAPRGCRGQIEGWCDGCLLTCSVQRVVIFKLQSLFVLAPLAGEAFSAPTHQSSCQLSTAENIENKL